MKEQVNIKKKEVKRKEGKKEIKEINEKIRREKQ